jgi:hypothetical protein
VSVGLLACSVCEYAAEHHSWPASLRGTHCKGCHRTWSGKKEAHCTACHAHFSTPSNFDAHLSPRGCAEPGAVTDLAGRPRLRPVVRASGAVWVGWAEREAVPA